MKNLLFPILALAMFSILSCGETTEPTIETTVSVEPFTTSIDEGQASGTYIGTVEGTTNQGRISYSLSNVNPVGALAIAASTGDLTVSDALAFTFVANEQITATVIASNNGVMADASVTININEVGSTKLTWTGATMTFTKEAGADPTEEANQDRITDNVWITRDNDGGQIFNIKTETMDDKNASPAGTEWAVGTIDEVDNLTFRPFRDALGKPKNQIGTDLVAHLIADDVYLSVKITSWDEEKAGGFAYERSTE